MKKTKKNSKNIDRKKNSFEMLLQDSVFHYFAKKLLASCVTKTKMLRVKHAKIWGKKKIKQ